MELDPKLTALAIAAVAPTKILLDSLVASVDIPRQLKLLFGYCIAFSLIVIYQGYSGEVARVDDVRQLLLGDILAAMTTMSGAVLATQMQKQVEVKKVERKKQARDNADGA